MLSLITIVSFIANVYLINRILAIYMKHKYVKKRLKSLEDIEREKIDEEFFDYDYSLKNKDTIYVNEKDKIEKIIKEHYFETGSKIVLIR